jgi:hypothetical protein
MEMTPEEFFGALEQMPMPVPVMYRLYHDDQGCPLFYSMEDVPGTYIEIDQETFAKNSTQIRVRNGKIVETTWKTTQKLVPSNSGTLCHSNDIAVVVDSNGTYWSKQTYETD